MKKPYGITGSIASGKSEVTKYLIEKKYLVIDSDSISHTLTSKGEIGYKKILEFFGKDILDENDQIDRFILSKIVFSDKEKLKLLNSIMHPIIREYIEKEIKSEKYQNEKIFFADIPLLFEAKLEDLCKSIILVYADEKTQIERLMQRDNKTFENAKKIISSQMPVLDKMKRSHFFIENNSSLNELYRKIENLLLEIE